ncbi:MAG: PEP-CTERM sorting domain-containing protein [Actinobacteria bacterium]|nr:PEP-CTERM sorting domain-containing protein [Actinomycetota bacterium]
MTLWDIAKLGWWCLIIKMKSFFCLLICFCLIESKVRAQLNWESFDVPGATHTWLDGIDGETIAGSFYDGTTTKGFLYNRQTEVFNILQAPSADWTLPLAISNGTVVGSIGSNSSYVRNGFAYYSGSNSWSLLNPPQGVQNDLEAYGIDGANIVGGTGRGMSFLLNGSNWTFFNSPFGTFSSAHGISGDKIVGSFSNNDNGGGGYIKENDTWTLLNVSGATETTPRDVDGNMVVGDYRVGDWTAPTRSFLFDGANWTYLDARSYYDTSDVSHGFILTIPEPSALSLLAVGLGGLAMIRRRSS